MGAKSIPFWVVAFWLIVWQVLSMIVGYSILLPSPLNTLSKLWILLGETDFWVSITSTVTHITAGFLMATVTGVIVAILSHRWRWVQQLFTPVMLVCKSVPVAAFIILVLIWFSSKEISIVISFIMVLPVIYTNMYTAISELDQSLNEMATVFALSSYAKVRYVLLPQIMPYFRSACLVSLGLAFKAGIAAEVIGLPKNSIGEELYSAKLYLDTPNLFAWTVAIVLLSFAYEKLFAKAIDITCTHLEKVRWK